MVSLLALTITPSVERKMMEKRGRAALNQAASMMVAVSHSSFRNILLNFFEYFEVADFFLFVFSQGTMAVAWAH